MGADPVPVPIIRPPGPSVNGQRGCAIGATTETVAVAGAMRCHDPLEAAEHLF
jgi:hypothetical protein